MVFVYIFVAIIQGLICGFVAQVVSENKGYDYRNYRCCLQTG